MQVLSKTFSSAVLGSAVQFVFLALALVAGVAAEELLPKFLGVGFPVLLALSQHRASGNGLQGAVLFSVAAGAFEDAISSLPPFTSTSFFILAAALARFANRPRMATALAYPVYHLWLAVWMPSLHGSVYGRMLAALPAGFATAFAVSAIMGFLERKAAVYGRG